MKVRYIDLVDQTFDWPQEEFQLDKDQNLQFHGIPLMELAQKYGTPLKFSYLPVIGRNIERAKSWFSNAFTKLDYQGDYHYCYVSKSSHFRFVLEEAVKNGSHLETSSAYDLDIIEHLFDSGAIPSGRSVICNGFKTENYINRINQLTHKGMNNIMPILDNSFELEMLEKHSDQPMDVGIRIASEEEPKFEFYTSRLGIGYKDILSFYGRIQENSAHLRLKMLHFFVNTGIRDTAYYWNELNKTLRVYCQLKKICPSLDSLNIGGGFPIKNSLGFEFDYEYLVESIIGQVKTVCEAEGVPHPHIYTEFGSFTVGESGGMLYKVLYQKKQNDKERWNMIDSSFMTTLPDSWAINKRFIMLPVNGWEKPYERVFLGGLTCDSDDYYNSEQHVNAIYLPQFDQMEELYLGFFNTGAYQDSLGGYGGVHHCLIPGPKHVLLDRDEEGNLIERVFSEEQTSSQMLSLLGF